MDYYSLYAAYGTIAVIVLCLFKYLPYKIWDATQEVHFDAPWKEFGIAILACLGVIGIGQLYLAGIRLPTQYPVLDAVNQILIFSPILALIVWRDKSPHTAFLNKANIHLKIGAGLLLAVFGIVVYTLTKGSESTIATLLNTYSYKNFSFLVQVLLEDITIAVLFIRLKKATSLKVALIIVPSLFAIGHIPAMIANGVSPEAFLSLFLDAGLGLFLIYTLDKTKDLLWFWMIHFAMDMMQFYA